MKISAQFGMWFSLVFAVLCLYIAFDGLSSLASLTDETQRADSRGFLRRLPFRAQGNRIGGPEDNTLR